MVDSASKGGGGGGQEEKIALVAGATGLVGKELVSSLLRSPSNWTFVYGIARRTPDASTTKDDCRYCFVQCDLQDQAQVQQKLGVLAGRVTHLFWATWASHFPLDTPECCTQNRTMLAHALDALLPAGSPVLRHVCLQTGTKHYVSLKAPSLAGPYLEEVNDLTKENHRHHDTYNFYYDIEKLLMERTVQGIVNSWSVHRPGLLFGVSHRSYFNVMGSLCVYACLCRHLGMPFRFYGTRFCWEVHYIDMSDAGVVADQQIWWALLSHDYEPRCEAFNAVDSSPFIWKQVWPALASKFGIEPETVEMNDNDWLSEEMCYSEIMCNKEQAWKEIVLANGLRKTTIEDLANWDFLDSLFRFSGKLLAAPGKAERLGFIPPHTYANTKASSRECILYWLTALGKCVSSLDDWC